MLLICTLSTYLCRARSRSVLLRDAARSRQRCEWRETAGASGRPTRLLPCVGPKEPAEKVSWTKSRESQLTRSGEKSVGHDGERKPVGPRAEKVVR